MIRENRHTTKAIEITNKTIKVSFDTNSLLDNKEITIDNYNILKNTILKIWVELDKNRLPKAIQVDVFNKSWDIKSNIIFYDMSRL